MYVCIIHIEEILMLPLSLSLVCMYCVYTSVMLVRITVVFVVSRMWIMLLCLGWTWSVRLSPCRRKSTSWRSSMMRWVLHTHPWYHVVSSTFSRYLMPDSWSPWLELNLCWPFWCQSNHCWPIMNSYRQTDTHARPLYVPVGDGGVAGSDPGAECPGGHGCGQAWPHSCPPRCASAVREPGLQEHPGVWGMV